MGISEMKKMEMCIEGYKMVFVKGTSFKCLCKVSFLSKILIKYVPILTNMSQNVIINDE